jgi:hypothetical protein
VAITAGVAPFLGVYRPVQALTNLVGHPANGEWRLRITDGAGGDSGTLICWSLTLFNCAGDGGCDLCPDIKLTSALGSSSRVQSDRLSRTVSAGECGSPPLCPGALGDPPHYYDAFTFRNGPSDACITVTLSSDLADVFSAAYLGAFDPTNLCVNYLADSGDSTFGISFFGPKTYSFNVLSNAIFVVTVNDVAGAGPYQLSVTGGNCRPILNIAPALPNQVRLDWPTFASGYALQSTPSLSPSNWVNVTNAPAISAGRYGVTNSSGPVDRFYRLRKP